MRNILDSVVVVFGLIALVIYIIIGATLDVTTKVAAMIVCIPIIILAAFAVPFFSRFPTCKPIKFLYRLGGKWQLCAENYFFSNKLLSHFLDVC